MKNIVEIDGVSVSYRESLALKEISLNIEKNDFLSVIGPNGAGKTTLLSVINGLGKITAGRVKIFGKILDKKTVTNIRKKVGYVPQILNIDPRMPVSVFEAVSIGRYGRRGLLQNLNHKDRQAIHRAFEMTGIEEFKERPVGHLSGGELQKVSIARALAQEPEIILFDEPVSNLDLKSRRDIINIIEKIYRDRDLTVVFVTHILNHIPDPSKRSVLVKEGKIIWQGKTEEIYDEELLSGLYECPVEIIKNGEEIFAEPRFEDHA
ncbi:MAG: metal ABC transporter ATP-binding protein [Elusimicrobiota bacterium]